VVFLNTCEEFVDYKVLSASNEDVLTPQCRKEGYVKITYVFTYVVI
jgi:hypothetical protein